VKNLSEPPEDVELMVVQLGIVVDTQAVDWHFVGMS